MYLTISVRTSRKAGLGVFTQNLEVVVRYQLGRQLSKGLTEAGNPPPRQLTHVASKLMWVSWFLSRWISSKNSLYILQQGDWDWLSAEQAVQEIKAKTSMPLWHGFRSNTPNSLDLTGQQWLNKGGLCIRRWIMEGTSELTLVCIVVFLLKFHHPFLHFE